MRRPTIPGAPPTPRLPAPCLASRAVFRGTVWLVAAIAASAASPSWADRLYGFADERGVFNFSDAASDSRHRLLLNLDTPRRSTAPQARIPPRPPERFTPLIHDVARQNRLDPALVKAVAFVESRFDHQARSPKGALGLMQLMPATAARFGVTDPLDPRQNLAGGARYLRELIDRFDSLPLALAAYNAGEGAVERYGNAIPPFAETVTYVPMVLNHYSAFRRQAPSDALPGVPRRAPSCC